MHLNKVMDQKGAEWKSGCLLTVNGLTDIGRWALEVDSSAWKDVKPAVDQFTNHILHQAQQKVYLPLIMN